MKWILRLKKNIYGNLGRIGVLLVLLSVFCGEDKKPVLAPKGGDPVTEENRKMMQLVKSSNELLDKFKLKTINKYKRPMYKEYRDPFVSYLTDFIEKKQLRLINPTKLERYSLPDISLFGIITGTYVHKAWFLAPNGKGYMVEVGDVISRNAAKVVAISRNKVTLLISSALESSRANKRFLYLEPPHIFQGVEADEEKMETEEELRAKFEKQFQGKVSRETASKMWKEMLTEYRKKTAETLLEKKRQQEWEDLKKEYLKDKKVEE